MTAIKLVIGDRLGKGQKVGAGAEAAGANVTIIPGMAGGAGAITAQTKYGYKCRYGMRSVEEGVTAINEGCVVLGFGFMDKEELGQKLVEAFAKKHGRA